MTHGPALHSHPATRERGHKIVPAAFIAATRAVRQLAASITWTLAVREISIVLGAYFLYSATRNLIRPGTVEEAFSNGASLVRLERVFGIFIELDVQQWFLLNFEAGLRFLTYVYTYGFWIALLGSAVLLFILRRELYYRMRRVFLISLCIGLAVFALFPLAPPRFFPHLGFVDAMRLFGVPVLSGEDSLISYNKFAAMPSLHYAWALLMAEAWRRYGRKALAWTAIAFQILILLAIIATANHYILDAALAVLVIIAAVRLGDWLHQVFDASTMVRPSFSPTSEARLLADRSNLCAVLRNSGASGAFTGMW